MKLKTNYFLTNMIDCNIDCVADYFENAKYNYVIMQNGQPVHWIEEDGDAPIIYGDKEDYENELKYNLDGYNEDGTLKDEFEVMTEWDFLMEYCLDAIISYMIKQIKRENNFDGVCYIHYMNQIVKYGKDDIIALYVSNDSELPNLSALIAENGDDCMQYFSSLIGFDKDTMLELIEDIFENVN